MSYRISIRDSIERILKTPRGSRVMLPTFGSQLHEIIDRRLDEITRLEIVRFVYEAIEEWEARVRFHSCEVVAGNLGSDASMGEKLTLNVKVEEKESSEIISIGVSV